MKSSKMLAPTRQGDLSCSSACACASPMQLPQQCLARAPPHTLWAMGMPTLSVAGRVAQHASTAWCQCAAHPAMVLVGGTLTTILTLTLTLTFPLTLAFAMILPVSWHWLNLCPGCPQHLQIPGGA